MIFLIFLEKFLHQPTKMRLWILWDGAKASALSDLALPGHLSNRERKENRLSSPHPSLRSTFPQGEGLGGCRIDRKNRRAGGPVRRLTVNISDAFSAGGSVAMQNTA